MKKLLSLFVALSALCSINATTYSYDFKTSQQGWTISNVSLDGLSSVWQQTSQYGMKASAYVSGVNHTTESWLISPVLNLSGNTSATLQFNHARRYGSNDDLSVRISRDGGSTWSLLSFPNWPNGNNWTFIDAGTVDISAYISSSTKIAFVYTSTSAGAATWEISNVQITATAGSGGGNIGTNTITYTADAKLQETTGGWNSSGLHTNAFNVSITSHTFADGIGTITFDDEVTRIGYYAFYDCSSLTSITIPNSVTRIGDYAFYRCSGLTSITIPNSVTSIGGYAFESCSGLTSITLPNSVTSIGNYAFYYCSGLTSITIPESVTSIGSSAFCYCSRLTSVTLPESVTSIGEEAFSHCSGLTSIVVESGNINYDSRENCNAIIETASNTLIVGCQNTIIPNSVTGIGDYAFSGCSGLTSITIPNSVTSIGNHAFAWCFGLTSITIPNSVTSIGEWAFFNCSDLTSITIPNSVTSIGNHAFYCCRGLTSITIPESVTSIGSSAFGYCSGLTSITIPNSVTSIGESAFYECSGLTSITCEATTPPTCGSSCFYEVDKSIPLYVPCGSVDAYRAAEEWNEFTNIQCIPAPNNVITYTATSKLSFSTNAFNVSITSHTFSDGVGTITFSGDVTSIGDRAFYRCSELTSITIPNSVTSIGGSAFSSCSGLTSITIPNSVTSIGVAAFYNCSGLTSIVVDSGNTNYDSREKCNAIIETASNTLIAGCQNTIIPNSVTSIGGYAFSGCTGLTSITIPNSVTSIGEWAFSSCSGLTSITIPNSVTSIGDAAFYRCSGLTSITCEATTPPTCGSSCFYQVDKSIPLYVPAESVETYKTAAEWRHFTNILPIATQETEFNTITYTATSKLTETTDLWYSGLHTNAFNVSMTSHTFADGTGIITFDGEVTSIGYQAFYECSGLTSVTIPNSVTSIGERAFYYCYSLTSITIPNSVTSIGNNAFEGCYSLTSITIPNSVTSIGESAFRYCSGLTSITIGNSVTSIGDQAFSGCKRLTSITIPNSVTSIGSGAFYKCSGLTSVTIGNSVTSIGERAFFYCYSLTSITIPNSVTSIGNNAFEGCYSLTSIVVESGNTNYDSRDNCNAIIETASNTLIAGCPNTIIPNSVTSIGNKAFDECDGLTSITIPNSVTSIGEYAFEYCSGLTSITCEAVTPPTCGEGCFEYVDHSIPLYVPEESVEAYKTAVEWMDFTNIQPIEPVATALDNATAPTDNLRKFMRDGQVLIQRGDMIYNMQGQVVE